jgi:hypothetical protein
MAMRSSPILLAAILAAAPVFAAEREAAPDTPAPATEGERDARADRERDDAVDRHCLKETGTRIRPRAGARHCAAVSGRVYTRRDLDRTGQPDVLSALRMLDPAVR